MAILAPVVGGGIFGNIALLGLGIGIQLAVAYFFPTKVKGPRQENLKAQTSRYGDHIARVHGTARVAGAVIWLKNDEVDEHKKKKQAGIGKGVGPETTTFSYTADFAVAFAWNGPFKSVTRMWADDKLFYDNGAINFEDIVTGGKKKQKKAIKNAGFTFYLGTQDQLPDPDIQADRGAASVPAWPGLCYCVITNFPLDEFGIRIPNIEAEIVQEGETSTFSVTPEDVTNLNPFPWNFDCYGDYFAGINGTLLQINELPSGDLLHSITMPVGMNMIHFTKNGELIVGPGTPGLFVVYDPAAGTQKYSFPWISAIAVGAVFEPADDIVIGGKDYFITAATGQLGIFENDGSGFFELGTTSGHGTNAFNPPLTISAGPEFIYMFVGGGVGGGLRLVPWSPSGGALVSSFVSPPSLSGNISVVHYHEGTDSVVIVTTDGVYVYDAALTSLLHSKTGDFTLGAVDDPLASKRLDATASTIAVVDTGGAGLHDVWEYNMPDLSLVEHTVGNTSGWTNVTNADLFYYAVNSNWHAIIPAAWFTGVYPEFWFLPMIAPSKVPLADVIAAECGFVELPNNVDDISGDVRGYAVRDGSPPRGVLEDLMRVKFFDFAHVDGITKFFMRNATVDGAIPLDYMGMTVGDPAPRLVQEEYADSRELPQRVVIDYQSFQGDYRKGSQSVTRPADMDETKATMQFDTSLIMDDDEAARSADIMFNETRESANIYRASIAPRFVEFHPGDVFNLDLDEARTVKAVLTKMSGEAAIEVELRKRTASYTSDAVGVPVPPNPDSLLDLVRSGLILIDGHLLRSANNDDGFYVGVYPAEVGRFGSATVYKSNDGGSTYFPWLGFPSACLRGYASAALPSVPHPNAWDRVNSLTFTVTETDGVPNLPESVTEEALLGDSELNGFAVKSGDEWEYIRAATCIDNGDGTWTLSTLLRGGKGTEFAVGGHALSDEVVFLDVQALDRSPEGDRTLERVYVPVTTSTVFDASFAVFFTNAGKGLRPWSPAFLEATRSTGDLIITWERRDRLGQDWPEDGPEDPPMSEATESYNVVVYDTGVAVRTIAAVTNTATYTAADQTTDFGSPQASIDIGVVQVSAVYGDGIEARAFL